MIDPSPTVQISEGEDGKFLVRWPFDANEDLTAPTEIATLEELLDFLSGYFDHSTEAASDEDSPGELRTT